MRLFFAIPIPDEILEGVRAVQETLRNVIGDEGVRWTRADQFHYTLKFLGEQSPIRARHAIEAARALAGGIEPFGLTLGGVGAFPNAQRPGTLWIGAIEGDAALADLASRLDQVLVKERFHRESRSLKAHLTLARVKTYIGEIACARALKTAQIGTVGVVTIDRFVLMQSTLKPTGAEYTVVEEFELVSST